MSRDQEAITQQLTLLTAHRHTLGALLQQQALLGGMAYASPGVINGIEEARTGIARCKATLRGWGIQVEDYPDDERYQKEPESHETDQLRAQSISRSQVEIIIKGALPDFTSEMRIVTVRALAGILDIPPDQISVLRVQAGSIILEVVMPTVAVTRLMALYKANDPRLRALGIQRVSMHQQSAHNTAAPTNTIAGRNVEVMGDKRTINTQGGDYAEGNIDKRQGAFISGGTIYGPVVGVNQGTLTTSYTLQQRLDPALHQLRAPVSDFVGRAHELDQLVLTVSTAADNGGAAAISGVRGMGGIGKTELAYVAAQRLAVQFPDAQLLVELRGASTNPLSSEAALQTIIRSFEREEKLPDDLAQLKAIYTSLLTGKRVLILADDARDAAQVRPLLPPAGCVLLVTSRHRFSLPGMTALDLSTLPPEEAAKLLLEICPRIGAHAPKLAQLCGYLPLALRVSAGMLEVNDTRSVLSYLQQLDAERLKHLNNPDDPTTSVEASLRLSYDALESSVRMALCQLSVFATSFDPAAALAVVAVEGDGMEVLELLRRRSLLDWDAQVQRFSLHDLVRVFAATYLEDADATRLRHAQHYARVAKSVGGFYMEGGVATLAGLALFDRERMHIDAGWMWAMAHAGDQHTDALLLDYPNALSAMADLRYDQRERILQLEAQRAAAQRLGQRDGEAYALGNLGRVYAASGDARRAISFYDQALIIARELGDRRAEAQALGVLGLAYDDLGDLHQAITFHNQRLAIARELGDQRSEGGALNNIGITYWKLGKFREAIPFFEQRLAITRELGDQRGESQALGNLGIAYKTLGDAQKAIPFYEKTLAIARELGDRVSEEQSLSNLGLAYNALGDVHQAITLQEEALVIARELGDLRNESRVLRNLGQAYTDLGNVHQGISFYDQALVIARELGDRHAEALVSWHLGLVLEREGDLAQAAQLMQVSVDYEQEIGHAEAEADAAYLAKLRQRLLGEGGGIESDGQDDSTLSDTGDNATA